MSTPPTATSGLDALAPASRFVLLLTQAGVATDLARRGFPITEDEAVRMRHEWRRCVSELGPSEARRRLLVFAESWSHTTGCCSFCAGAAHEAGFLTCPTLPGAEGRDV
jgi:hypothetical protein